MKTQDWFKSLLNTVKDTFAFRLETLIINTTEKICEHMKLKSISRTDLAQRLEVSSPAVTKILNGNSNFTLKTLLALADALGLELKVDFQEKNACTAIPASPHAVYYSAIDESAYESYVVTSVDEPEIPYLLKSSSMAYGLLGDTKTPKTKAPKLSMAA
jgi:transcriptional regulator with XRE-family HTH domain